MQIINETMKISELGIETDVVIYYKPSTDCQLSDWYGYGTLDSKIEPGSYKTNLGEIFIQNVESSQSRLEPFKARFEFYGNGRFLLQETNN